MAIDTTCRALRYLDRHDVFFLCDECTTAAEEELYEEW